MPNAAPSHTSEQVEGIARAIVRHLLRLRAAGAFDPRETKPGRQIWRWRFRAAGWPVDVDLDDSVGEMRVYHDRDEVAMAGVPRATMDALLGRAPLPATTEPVPPAEESLAALRRVIAAWKDGNARIFTVPPVKVGHPDNWNDA